MRKAKAVDRLFGCPPGTVVMTDILRNHVRVFDSWKEATTWMMRWHPDCFGLWGDWPKRKPRSRRVLSRHGWEKAGYRFNTWRFRVEVY